MQPVLQLLPQRHESQRHNLEYESTNANRGLNVLKHVLYSCFKTVFYARVLKHVLKHDNPV